MGGEGGNQDLLETTIQMLSISTESMVLGAFAINDERRSTRIESVCIGNSAAFQ